MNFHAQLFNVKLYIAEGMKFGVFTGLTVVISFYAWYYISQKFQSQISLASLSLHSFLLNVDFDFSYSLFIMDFSMQTVEFLGLFTFLFTSMVSIFFGIQMKQISFVWRANTLTDDLRLVFFKLFAEMSLLTSFTSWCVNAVFDFPIICLPYLYSFFIPQIIHTALTPGKKKGDELFVILTSLQHLFPVWYFTLYKKNIVEIYCPKIAIIITVYVLLQVIVIILQNRFGGCFFLPKSMRPNVFDYHSLPVSPDTECAICMTPIEEGDDTMVTPCHHAFHTRCLTRWMDEQLICPICRANLPPIEN